MDERDVEKFLVRKVEDKKGQALKFNTTKNGMPDRIILLPGGKIVFVEVKAPKEKPRPLQVKRMKDLEKLGFKTAVVDSKAEAGQLIERLIT